MDLHLKQWNQQQQQQEDESEGRQHQQQQQQPSAKFPKLLLQPRPQQLPPSNHNTTNNNRNSMKDHPPLPLSSAGSTLPLFVPDHPDPHQPTNRSSSSSSSSSSPMIEMGSYFSFVQWQELELQALIYRYMLSGIPVPPQLLHLIKRNLSHPSPSTSFLQQNHPHLSYFLHHPQSQPFRFQSGYWGRASMDPEPGRCRRTDGKKWRCSRDVVPGQKYCERHVHRGRNRSRKPVEISPTNSSQDIVPGGNLTSSTFSVTVASIGSVTAGNHFAISGSGPPIDLFQMNKSHSNFRARTEPGGGQVLRHFFDDWPRTLQEPEVGSLTGLSMSIGSNPSSDVSLKLSTGDDESDRARGSNWLTGWSSPSGTASAGGPLAEALRSSATTTDYSSPTSVLHRLTCGLAAETGLVTQV